MDRTSLAPGCRQLPTVALLVTLGLLALTPMAAAAPRHAHAPDRVIVGLEATATRGDRRAVTAAAGERGRRFTTIAPGVVLVHLPAGEPIARAVRELGRLPGVAYVERDYRVTPAAVADDPWTSTGEQWGVYGPATAPHANAFGSGAVAAWAAEVTGTRDVFIGVIDEGVASGHPDLAANAWRNPFEAVNGIDDDGNGYVDDLAGWDFYHDDASVYDGTADDHGTHVAGTIGAEGGNGVGVAGVSWQVTLIPVKFMGPGGGYVSAAVRAIDYLTDLRLRHDLPIVASNNSWSGGGYSQALADAIVRAGDAGILFIAAAGNEGRDIDVAPAYPAAYRCDRRADGQERGWDCLIAVGAITSDGSLHDPGNWGATSVDLGAPGRGIVSTYPADGYAFLSGTSMAAAHVSGAVALCASLDPAAPASRIRERVLATSSPTAALDGRTVSGGRLDVAALASACSPPAEPPPGSGGPGGAVITLDDLEPAFRRSGDDWGEGATGFGGHHYWLPTRDGPKANYGAWRPDLPQAGWYDVEVYVPSSPNLSRKANYRVRTEDGWVTRVRNQEKRQGGWVSLGVHRLGTTAIVQLADRTGEASSLGLRLTYDAARFVPLDDLAPLDGPP